LFIRQTRNRGAYARLALDQPDFERPQLGFRLGSGGKILADTLAVQPARYAENDFPGGIREL
jgi:hypothetical protein